MSTSRELLQTLVGFDTTSRESNLMLIEFVRDYLAGFGVASELVYNDERSKANLFASVGPAQVPGIVLSGHTDVVPVDGQPWTLPAFALTERDGKLYGRGTADMKGYIACVLALVPALVEADLRMPVHIALSYDEEVGCLGVRSLLEVLDAMAGETVAVRDRRTHRTQAGAGPQGQVGDALRGARRGVPFGVCAVGGERHRICCAIDHRTGPAR